MTATSGKQLSVGLRSARIYALDSSGYPAANSTTVYEGLELYGPKAYTLESPTSRKIVHLGNDRVLALDYLPPVEGMGGELRSSVHDLELNAYLAGVEEFTVGEAKMMPLVTDKQGSEPDTGMLLFQQSLDRALKLRRWRFHIVPSAHIYPMPVGMDENASEMRYTFAPNPVTKHLWGTALATGTEGATEAAMIEGMAENKPHIVSFLADGVEDNFLFHVDRPSAANAKLVVWDNGTLKTVTTHYTIDALGVGITFLVAPTAGHFIVVYYEY